MKDKRVDFYAHGNGNDCWDGLTPHHAVLTEERLDQLVSDAEEMGLRSVLHLGAGFRASGKTGLSKLPGFPVSVLGNCHIEVGNEE